MGTYSHLSDEELTQLRTRLVTSLTDRLTGPSAASTNGRSIQYQQRTDEIRSEIADINRELARRAGRSAGGPIYLVG